MAEQRYYWLKLKKDFFEDRRVVLAMNMDSKGPGYILFYLKLLCEGTILSKENILAVTRQNIIQLTEDYGYSEDFIDSAIKYLCKYRLLKIVVNNYREVLYVAECKTHSRLTEVTRNRNSPDYREWRKAVFERDDYTCQYCGERGGRLNAHHIKSWRNYEDLRYEVENGITLCEECHKKLHRENGRGNDL